MTILYYYTMPTLYDYTMLYYMTALYDFTM